jgi:hypothetical protein
LPVGFKIFIDLEEGAATVAMEDDDGNQYDANNEGALSEQINLLIDEAAILAAKAQEGK